MPFFGNAPYVKSQKDSKNVSAYGLAFLKSEFYSAGGRPAIYGLSTDNVTYQSNSDFSRFLSESILPVSEQFRYVSYNPKPNKWIDWSHEREWRWRSTDPENEYIWCMDGNGCFDAIPGLRLFAGSENSGHFSKVFVIVWNKEEALEIQEMLTGFYLAGGNNYDSPFSKSVLKKSKIIVLNEVISAVEQGKSLDSQTIEGIEAASLINPLVIHAPSNSELEEKIKGALEAAAHAGKIAADDYMSKHDINHGYCGFAYACTFDVTTPLALPYS